MLTASGYKCGLLTTKSRRIRNVGNLFSVSFSRLLTRYSAVTNTFPKNSFAATNDIKTFTAFIFIRLPSNNVFATSTKNKISLAFFRGRSTAGAFGYNIMLDSYLTDNLLRNLKTTDAWLCCLHCSLLQ